MAVPNNKHKTEQVDQYDEKVDSNKEMHNSSSQYINDCQNLISRKSQVIYKNSFNENINLKLDTCQFQTENARTLSSILFHGCITHIKLNIEINGQYYQCQLLTLLLLIQILMKKRLRTTRRIPVTS